MGSVLSVVSFSSIARPLLLTFCLWNHDASAQNPSKGVLHDSDELSSTRGLIGLVVLPQLYGSGSPRCLSHDVPLYRSATSALPFGKLYLAERTKAFQWPTIRMAVDDRADEPENPTLEFAYEERGAIASARKNGRARIALHEGTAWITLRGCHAFLDVPTILKEKSLEFEVGARALAVTAPRGQRAASTTAWPAAELIDAASVGGALWLHLKPAAHACGESGDAAHGEEEIWLPFLDADRFPTVWFHSRGC